MPRSSKSEKKRSTPGFSKEEKAAMRAAVQERKAHATREEGERAVLEKIAGMDRSDRVIAERVHAIVRAQAPELAPRTWYGMPAYANAEGDVVCFFQDARKFGARYATLGFNDAAKLDEGTMWATGFALTQLTAAEEARIAALVKRAVG